MAEHDAPDPSARGRSGSVKPPFGIVSMSHVSALVGHPNRLLLRINGATAGSTVYVVFLSKFVFLDEDSADRGSDAAHTFEGKPVTHKYVVLPLLVLPL